MYIDSPPGAQIDPGRWSVLQRIYYMVAVLPTEHGSILHVDAIRWLQYKRCAKIRMQYEAGRARGRNERLCIYVRDRVPGGMPGDRDPGPLRGSPGPHGDKWKCSFCGTAPWVYVFSVRPRASVHHLGVLHRGWMWYSSCLVHIYKFSAQPRSRTYQPGWHRKG